TPTPRRPSDVLARLHAAPETSPTISFELYPPRTPAGHESLWRTIEHLTGAAPDFFSVTYGASGSSRETSRAVVRHIAATTDVPVVAHLTCIGAPRHEVRAVAEAFIEDGVRTFLALRGDPPAGVTDWEPHPQGLQRGSDLVALLRDVEAEHDAGPLSIAVAANPGALRESPADELCGDLQALVAKQEAGADFAITQVFFEVDAYVAYLDAARAAGVTIPLLPGIVPLNDPARLRRLQEVSGVAVPAWILQRLDAEDEQSRWEVGAELGAQLVSDVLAAGAPGLHLYTFNQHRATLELLAAALPGHGTLVR
ncbi:MAG TPA: methylenetetrahydrofolate reductase, partial [Actinotalea sp.]